MEKNSPRALAALSTCVALAAILSTSMAGGIAQAAEPSTKCLYQVVEKPGVLQVSHGVHPLALSRLMVIRVSRSLKGALAGNG